MNERRSISALVLLCALFVFSFSACKTLPVNTDKTDGLFVDVIETQTEVIETGKDVAETISNIKAITDDAKNTGEIPKEKVITIIKYVDQSSDQIKAHNAVVKTLTGQIADYERSRQTDNANHAVELGIKEGQYQREKLKASIFWKWALISTLAALILAGVIFLPKIIRLK